jgi:hypothetical protein
MTLFTSFTGLVAKTPPPWSVMPELPLTTLRETLLRVKFNGPPGGPLGTAASKMPPPERCRPSHRRLSRPLHYPRSPAALRR